MLAALLKAVVRTGTLTVQRPGSAPLVFGSGEPRIAIRFHDRRGLYEVGMNPDMKLGELYMDGRLTVEDGSIRDLLDFLMRNLAHSGITPWHKAGRVVRRMLRPFKQFNRAAQSKAHVAHHYDLSDTLYDLFLDKDRQYSCAYFNSPDDTLEEAQIAKKRHIAAKLSLDKTDMTVLDIGSGWGGLSLDIARDTGAKVLGVTLSEEQLAVSRERSAKAGLAQRCRFELTDYRALTGKFDRIVSVGMFEHVGAPYYEAFFAKVRDLLSDDGAMLLHTIGRTDGPGATNAWIAKYIFPGGYVPALSEVLPIIERSGLIVTDIEVLRLHYAETLLAWQQRFAANRAEIAKLYDERFCRMWEFYLAGSEMAFRHDGQVVFQIQLAKKIDTLPMTRDYMYQKERTMRFAGVTAMPHEGRAA
ncbi:MAG TPA: cyclopropane-fatty-acyl-phospholipid synthase family protein [Rhizomicrobium sp.]|nr:cyclopropane-fatty-acyl-phospholipid synthase family protein [Rhizomicrobium sp.]